MRPTADQLRQWRSAGWTHAQVGRHCHVTRQRAHQWAQALGREGLRADPHPKRKRITDSSWAAVARAEGWDRPTSRRVWRRMTEAERETWRRHFSRQRPIAYRQDVTELLIDLRTRLDRMPTHLEALADSIPIATAYPGKHSWRRALRPLGRVPRKRGQKVLHLPRTVVA